MLLPAHYHIDTESTKQEQHATAKTMFSAINDMAPSIPSPQEAFARSSDDHSTIDHVNVPASDSPGDQQDRPDVNTLGTNTSGSQSRGDQPDNVEKEGSKQARGQAQPEPIPQHCSNMRYDAVDVVKHGTPFKRPPFFRSEHSFANPTKASLGWQVEKRQSPSLNLSRRPAWSPPVSRPGTGHQRRNSMSFSPLPKRSEGSERNNVHCSPRNESQRHPPRMSQDERRHHETECETSSLVNDHLVSGRTNIPIIAPSCSLKDTTEVHCASMDAHSSRSEDPEYHGDPAHRPIDMGDAQSQPRLHDAETDVLHLCGAWSKACATADIPSGAVDHLHLLMETSEVDPASRNAAYAELESNRLAIYIRNIQQTIRHRIHQSDQDDELEQLRRENASLRLELDHLNRSKANEMANPHRLYRRELAKLQSRRTATPVLQRMGILTRQEIRDLEERLTKEREEEDAIEALRQRVRTLSVERCSAHVSRKSVFHKPLPWPETWRVEDCWEELTEDEKDLVHKL